MIICAICKGTKIIKIEEKIEICPKCKGVGKIESLKEEKEKGNKKLLLD